MTTRDVSEGGGQLGELSAMFLGVYHKNRFVIYIYIVCSILIFVTVVTVVTLVYIYLYILWVILVM